MEAAISLFLVGFYGCVAGLTRIRLLRQKPQLLRLVHWSSWGFSLLLAAVYAGGKISLRGQWFEILPVAVALVAAGSYFLLRRKQMGWAGKLYFGTCTYYPILLAGAFLFDRIFFLVVSAPVFALLPQTDMYRHSAYTFRSASTPLGPPRVALVTACAGLFERHNGTCVDLEAAQFTALDSAVAIQLLPSPHRDTTIVLISTQSRQFKTQFAQ
ncbi:hypothetical protein Hsw_2006 [Hymenobacter swuensis DY53]|uniref:Uncharacterized protein n=1 Tax=Hymenobacter swuensis DY53 TaxID=1227739 RepID=W8F4R6_9BACT|nr:hypothetical protein Hsw_2006 [Hymenobacter swuensis DY53]